MSKWMQTAETDQPWVVYTYGLTHDKWWPFWNSTRVLGRMRIKMTCAVCGTEEAPWLRIPRFGPIPDKGRHPARIKFLLEHVHPDRPHPMSWSMPFLNPGVHQGGIDLDLLAMRLQADLNGGAA
jgi:hypothetical protein